MGVGRACGETMQATACSHPPLKIICHQRIPGSFLRCGSWPEIENLGPAVALLAQMLDAPPIGRQLREIASKSLNDDHKNHVPCDGAVRSIDALNDPVKANGVE